MGYKYKLKDLYSQDYRNLENILRGKDKASIDFEIMAKGIAKERNISLDEAKGYLHNIMTYKAFAELVGMVRGGTAVKYAVKPNNFAVKVPDEVNANGKLPVVGKTEGYSNQVVTLFDELTQKGVKFTQNDVVSISKLPNGKIVFLEKGNSNSGLQHIIQRHGSEFSQKGITENQIPQVLIKALKENKVVGYQGKGRPIYEVNLNGQRYGVAITVGSNGYIVGANLTSLSK